MPSSDSVTHARRINRTWIVRGELSQNTARYLEALEARDPALLREVCARAVAAAQQASQEQRDPKPDFYASLFSRATAEERELYLKEHAWTRKKSAELASGE